MNKKLRQQRVLEIVTKTEVDTQEELIKILEDQGLKVTQATVSRDVKDLGLVKTSGKVKKYIYSNPVTEEHNDIDVFIRHFKTAVISVAQAQNTIVLRTLSGNANAVGVIIDGKNVAGVLGTIAGDDTLLIITPDNQTAEQVLMRIKSIFQL